MDIWAWLRGLAFAWLRYAVACLIVSTPITFMFLIGNLADRKEAIWEKLAGFAAMVGVGGIILLLGSPLVLAYRVIAKKEAPYLKWGYWLVVIYGPTLVYAETRDLGSAIGVGIVYEIAALAVFAIYVWVWKVGDRVAEKWRRNRVQGADPPA